MDADKAEFKRLVELMGWSQTETARRLAKSPSAVNHLLNPDHPNRPAASTLRLLKLVIATERPDFFKRGLLDLKDGAANSPEPSKLSAKEFRLIEQLRSVSPDDQKKIYAVVTAMVSNSAKFKPRKA